MCSESCRVKEEHVYTNNKNRKTNVNVRTKYKYNFLPSNIQLRNQSTNFGENAKKNIYFSFSSIQKSRTAKHAHKIKTKKKTDKTIIQCTQCLKHNPVKLIKKCVPKKQQSCRDKTKHRNVKPLSY